MADFPGEFHRIGMAAKPGNDDRHLSWGIWRRWVFANAWSELVGLGGSAGVALLLFGVAESDDTASILLAAASMIVIATILEGAVVGLAQWLVLRRVLTRLAGPRWIAATALGALVAWSLGMIPSTLMSLRETTGEAVPPELGAATVIALAFVMGLALGPILALFQWWILRRHLEGAIWWIPGNAVAWAFGMTIIFAGAGSISTEASLVTIVALFSVTCLLAGAVVGAIHGLVLIRLLPYSVGQTTPKCAAVDACT